MIDPTPAEVYANIREKALAENAARNEALKVICDAYKDDVMLPTPLMLAIVHARGLLNDAA